MRGRARARSAGLLVRDLRGEVVVYDTLTHQAHCLNAAAASVFRHADGRRTPAEIATLLGPGADEELVAKALGQLAGAGLLEPSPEGLERAPSRREALKQVGLGAVLLAPLVTSLLVPTPAEASLSCIPAAACNGSNNDQPCTNGGQAECATHTCQGPGLCV